MIYVLDADPDSNDHSKYILDILKEHTETEVKLIVLNNDITFKKLYHTISSLLAKVFPYDIVLCAWAVPGNDLLDELFSELSTLCFVVAAAGNSHKPIEEFTPARSSGVITVGTLNKSGLIAALSNFSSSKEIIWIPGTNYNVGWKNSSGTSVSAALYAAFLAESLNKNDYNLLDQLIESHKQKVFSELKLSNK